MKPSRPTPGLVPTALALLAAAAALAPGVALSDDIGHEAARRLVEAGTILPLSEVLERVHAEVPGKLLETELEYDDDDGLVYEIKVLRPGGRVQEIEVDAATGRILAIEDDD